MGSNAENETKQRTRQNIRGVVHANGLMPLAENMLSDSTLE